MGFFGPLDFLTTGIFDMRLLSHECKYTDCKECDGFVGDAEYDCRCDCHDEEEEGD